MVRTLDTDMKQVLVNYPDDADGFFYHHRCLVAMGPDGKWVGITPDHEIVIVNVVEFQAGLVPLRRNGEFPAFLQGCIYAFAAFQGNEEQDLRDECFELAALLGFPNRQVVPTLGVWRISDTASDLFGEQVPEEATSDESVMVVRGATALVKLAGEDEGWTTAERVLDEKLDMWKLKKWTGGGRDPRLAAHIVDKQGRRVATEVEAMATWSAPKERAKENPLQGPSVCPEFCEKLRIAGRTLVGHNQEWVQKSGVPQQGTVARFHTALSEVLRYLIAVDQLDPLSCVCAEICARYLVMVEQACDKNPKAPDWDGLEVLVSPAMTQKGAVEVPVFQSWVSGVQKDRAIVLKQGRLLREERASDAKRRGKGDGKGNEGPE